MKQIISSLIFTAAMSTQVTLSQDVTLKARTYTLLANGANKTATFLGSGFETTKNIACKVPGVTFLGNNKLNLFYATVGAYATTEVFLLYKGKKTFARKAFDYVGTTRLGAKAADACKSVKEWFKTKTTAVQNEIKLTRDLFDKLNNLDTTNLVTKTEVGNLALKIANLEKVVNDLKESLKLYPSVEESKKAQNQINILTNQIKQMTDTDSNEIGTLKKELLDSVSILIDEKSKKDFISSEKYNIDTFNAYTLIENLTKQVEDLKQQVKNLQDSKTQKENV